MIDTGDPFVTAVATKGVDVVGVAHLGRRPPPAGGQRSNGSTPSALLDAGDTDEICRGICALADC